MRRETGFTLVELLAALVTGAMVLVAIGWSFSAIMRLLPADPAEAQARRLAGVAPTIERLLESAAPAGFSGDAASLTATVSPPLAAGAAGPLRLRLAIASEAGGQSLVAELELAASDLPAAARRIVLAEGWRSIRFDYAREDSPETGSLPRLIILRFDDGHRVRRIAATPRIDSDGACRFDPVSMSCRS